MSLSAFTIKANVRVSQACTPDADTLCRLHADLFSTGWPVETFLTYCSSPHYLVMKAFCGETLAGLIVCQAILEEGEILTFGVAQGYRRQGIGLKLLTNALADLKERGIQRVLLDVAETNTAARALYKSQKFQIVARRESYYPTAPEQPASAALIVELRF